MAITSRCRATPSIRICPISGMLTACHTGAEWDKDGRMNIEIKVNNREDRYAYHLEVYDNGHAYIDVSADERDRIGFAGMMNVGR